MKSCVQSLSCFQPPTSLIQEASVRNFTKPFQSAAAQPEGKPETSRQPKQDWVLGETVRNFYQEKIHTSDDRRRSYLILITRQWYCGGKLNWMGKPTGGSGSGRESTGEQRSRGRRRRHSDNRRHVASPPLGQSAVAWAEARGSLEQERARGCPWSCTGWGTLRASLESPILGVGAILLGLTNLGAYRRMCSNKILTRLLPCCCTTMDPAASLLTSMD